MQIHDINLVADLTAHDPNDPFPCDGTYYGKSYESDSLTTLQTFGDTGADYLVPEWNGPWPTLTLTCNFVQGVFNLLFEICVDLLDQVSVENFYVGIADDDSISTPSILSSVTAAIGLIDAITDEEEAQLWASTMAVTWVTCKIISMAKWSNPWLEGLFYLLLATWWVSFIMNMAFTVEKFVATDATPLTVSLAFGTLFLVYLLGGYHSWYTGGSRAWQEIGNAFHPWAVHGKLDWAEGYTECFKMRTGLIMTIAQWAAVIVVIVVAAGLYAGVFN